MSDVREVNIYRCKLVKENTFEYGSKSITHPEDVFELARNLGYEEFAEEYLGLFCLSVKGQIIGYHEVSHGIIDGSMASPREIFKRALVNNATAIILVHNHPSGDATPSLRDIEVTKNVCEIGKLLGIRLVDHVIVGDGHFRSLKSEIEN